jgi:hypothetical protein
MVLGEMRRGMRVQVAFAPTRLSDEYLRGAYEELVPVVEKAVKGSRVDAHQMRPTSDERRLRSRRMSQ